MRPNYYIQFYENANIDSVWLQYCLLVLQIDIIILFTYKCCENCNFI